MTVGRIYSNVSEFADRNILHIMLEQKEKQLEKYRQALHMIAEDCDSWLKGESDEPSMEFIQLVQKFAKNAENMQ